MHAGKIVNGKYYANLLQGFKKKKAPYGHEKNSFS